MGSTSRQATGQQGETLAQTYLTEKGYTILQRNWKSTDGEIDIVAKNKDCIIFVEVRTRHSETTESAFESITPRKQQRLIRAAYAYIQQQKYPDNVTWRIDVVAVALRRNTAPLIEHSEDALGW